jgi:endonuclease G
MMSKWRVLSLTVLALVMVGATVSESAAASLVAQGNAQLLATRPEPEDDEDVKRHVPYGMATPLGDTADEVLLVQKDYVIWYDRGLMVPLWVAYLLEGNQPPVTTPGLKFRRDPRLAKAEAVGNEEYTHTDYQRGHMAPRADFLFDLIAVVNTYITTNACPQYPAFNSPIWRDYEIGVRRAADARGKLWVRTGAIFDSDHNGRRDPERMCRRVGTLRRIARPTHFYKILLVERQGVREVQAAIFEHKRYANPSTRPSTNELLARRYDPARGKWNGRCTVDEVERITGVNFFPGLHDDEERTLESTEPTEPWPELLR